MALTKKGTLSDQDIKSLVREWHNTGTEGNLNKTTVQMEMRALKNKVRKYYVPQLGDIPTERDDGMMRILVCQMGGCVSKEIRENKITAVEKLIICNDNNVIAFMALN
jgi:hypothetical protein